MAAGRSSGGVGLLVELDGQRPTGSDGGLRLFTQSGTHLVVDVSGWYV